MTGTINTSFTTTDTGNHITYNGSLQSQELDFNGLNIVYDTLAAGNYRIDVKGAQGGTATGRSGSGAGGRGGEVTGQLYLSATAVLEIVIGGTGSAGTQASRAAGGGGGTFVFLTTNGAGSAKSALLVAGGGGGAGIYYSFSPTSGAYSQGVDGSGGGALKSGTNGGGGLAAGAAGGGGGGYTGGQPGVRGSVAGTSFVGGSTNGGTCQRL